MGEDMQQSTELDPLCECVACTIRTDYGTGVEHDVDTSSCPVHGGDEGDEDPPCGCDVHPRWCAWNGPCCDSCSHGADEAHAECCSPSTSPGLPATLAAPADESEGRA